MSDSVPEQAQKGPRQSMLVGVAWMIGFRAFDRAAGLISILVLARLLLPEHFGVVALATGIAALIELLASLGLDAILLRMREPTRADYDTAWSIQLVIAALCALLLCIAAVPAAHFFREPRLAAIIYGLAAGQLLDGFVNIRIVDFRRELRFDKEFLFMATRRLVAVSTTMVAAYMLRNEWALVCGILGARAAGVAMSYAMRPALPRLTFEKLNEMLGHSTFLFAGNIGYFARQRAAEFTLGRLSGSAAVGGYMLASDLANTLSQELVSPINRVALPNMSSDVTPSRVAERLDSLTGQLGVLLTPLCFGLSACAEPVVSVLFGEKWTASAELLRILAISGWVSGIGSNIGVGFVGLGRYRANASIQLGGAGVLIPLLIFGVLFDQARGAAWAVLCANCIVLCALLLTSLRMMRYGPLQFFLRILRPVLASTLMYAFILWFASTLPSTWPAAARLAAQCVAGGAAYLSALTLLYFLSGTRDGAERVTVVLVMRVWHRIWHRT